MTSPILVGVAAALLAPAVFCQRAPSPVAPARQQVPVITVAGQSFPTWASYTSSALFQQGGLRCATPARDPLLFATAALAPSDCGYNSTTIDAAYDPGVVYTIPVVVHVIKHTNGQGNISAAMVQSQIDILNEDFRALPGSNGAPGFDSYVQFELASVDPSGAPTTGITYSTNNTWFNDGGGYWNTLAWDTNRYLNIYTNNASGYLGYVPNLPQGGIVGSPSDRVVCLWSAFGLNSPIGSPYNLGRTVTHEVGHYLGLFHTFDGGCGSSNCYGSGDLICDTAREYQPTFGCNLNKTSCGSPDPIHNYLDYSDDSCMNQFTQEQSNRMRCTLEHWRPNLASAGLPGPGTALCFGDGSGPPCPCGNNSAAGEGCKNSTGQGAKLDASGSNSILADDLQLVVQQGRPNQPGIFFQGQAQIQIPFWDGQMCAAMPIIRLEVVSLSGSGSANSSVSIVNKGGVSSGSTHTYQFWYRDNGGPCSTGSNLSGAYQVTWQ